MIVACVQHSIYRPPSSPVAFAVLLPGGITPKDGPSTHVDVAFLIVDSRVHSDENVDKPIEGGESLQP